MEENLKKRSDDIGGAVVKKEKIADSCADDEDAAAAAVVVLPKVKTHTILHSLLLIFLCFNGGLPFFPSIFL